MKNKIYNSTFLLLSLILFSSTTYGALAYNSTLLIGPQTTHCYSDLGIPGACELGEIPDANYFGIDVDPYDGVSLIHDLDLISIEAGLNGGIALGAFQEPGDIDAYWELAGGIGSHTQAGTLSIASDDGTGNVTLDMTGWNISWNGGDINLDLLDTNLAYISCNNTCENGDTYTLNYNNYYLAAGGFPSLELYTLHLSGTISAIPVPASIWLFGSGLAFFAGVFRRRK